ncbi:MAG: metallophosphoesterase family protein [Methanobacteriaceae archaeon]|nr:metallophosphoesterase family protein [Methanobacteriaceae archaeon]
MKILAVSDLHGKGCQIIADYIKKHPVDLIVIAGDITHFGPLELAEDILNDLCSCEVPVVAVPGNCDPPGIHSKIDNSRAINIHGKSLTIKNIGICGFGGSNPTPFDTPLEFDEIEIYNELNKVMGQIKGHDLVILVTHAPPHGTKVDQLNSGDYAGSESLRKIIEQYKPDINICGHIHEAKAVDKIGNTILVNPGELSEGFASLIDIKETNNKPEINVKIVEL